MIARIEKNDRPPKYKGAWRFGGLRRNRQIWKQLELEDGVLYRKYSPGPRQETTLLKILSKHLVPEVLKQLHEDPLAGHLGEDKTIARVRTRYYWHNFTRDILEFIESCTSCQRRKRPVPLQSIPVGGPFEMLDMDILELRKQRETTNTSLWYRIISRDGRRHLHLRTKRQRPLHAL